MLFTLRKITYNTSSVIFISHESSSNFKICLIPISKYKDKKVFYSITLKDMPNSNSKAQG